MVVAHTLLSVDGRQIDPSEPLTSLFRRGDQPQGVWGPDGGIVGWGEAWRIDAATWADAVAAWSSLRWRRAPHLPAPRALAALSFDPDEPGCTLVVPQAAVIQCDGTRHLVVVGPGPSATPPHRPADSWTAPLHLTDEAGYRRGVETALDAITRGDVSKVVLGTTATAALPGWASGADLAARLAARHPMSWVYAIDGLIGASPEMLLRTRGRNVSSRVLAGTVARAEGERSWERATAPGGKNRREHAWAATSAVEALTPVCSDVTASADPWRLELPHVWHLATDVSGTLREGETAMSALARLHPTAAVAGTPTASALATIAAIEGIGRDRFAAPVGWLDAEGDAEFAIALRGAQIAPDGNTLQAWAGAGIVAGSTPADEWAEVQAKFRTIGEALSQPTV